MAPRTLIPRLGDMIEAIERIREITVEATFEAFEADWQKRWLVERGFEIVSEASRHLPEELKIRHPEVPWDKVAGIGNVLRHDYERVAADVLWKIAQTDLHILEAACRDELAAERKRHS